VRRRARTIASTSSIIASSTCRRSGGVDDDRVAALRDRALDRRATSPATRSPFTVAPGTPSDFPSDWKLNRPPAGRWTSAATSSGWRPCLRRTFASFATVVVLPEPCSPMSAITVGGRSAFASGAASPPSISTSGAVNDLDDHLRARDRLEDLFPDRASRTVATSWRTILKLTSASRSATRTSRSASSRSASVDARAFPGASRTSRSGGRELFEHSYQASAATLLPASAFFALRASFTLKAIVDERLPVPIMYAESTLTRPFPRPLRDTRERAGLVGEADLDQLAIGGHAELRLLSGHGGPSRRLVRDTMCTTPLLPSVLPARLAMFTPASPSAVEMDASWPARFRHLDRQLCRHVHFLPLSLRSILRQAASPQP